MKKFVSGCAAIAAVMTMLSVQAEFAYEFTATVNYKGAETLVDFPVLVRLPGLVTSRMRNDGLDIRFFAEDGETELAHELLEAKRGSESFYYVKVPSLSVGTKLVVRFGDPDFDTPAAGASTWSSYIGVWHLDDIKGTAGVVDATGGCAKGNINSKCNAVVGKLMTAYQPTGVTDWFGGANRNHKILVTNKGTLATDGQLTVSWWMKPNVAGAMPQTTDKSIYFFQMKNASSHLLWDVHYQLFDGAAPTFNLGSRGANNGELTEVSVADADVRLNRPDWLHMACTLATAEDGQTSSGRIFADVVQLAQKDDLQPLQSAGTGGAISIGASLSGEDSYCGVMDEVRLRAVVSSIDWLQAERDSVNNPEFVQMPADLPKIFTFVTRRVVATLAEKEGDWEDATVAGDDAYAAIQGVIDMSTYGDVILFKAGRYVLTNELRFADYSHSGVTLRSDDGTGNLARKTTLLVGGYPATQNRLINCAAEGVQVEGFTFTNGYVDATCGGAIWFSRADARTRVSECDFLGNTAWWAAKEKASGTPGDKCSEGAGGAVFIEGAGVISNCLFRGNRGFSGAGVQTKSSLTVVSPVTSVPYVTRCSFLDNSTWGPGNYSARYGSGAGVCSFGAAVVDHSSFTSNYLSSVRGTGIACSGNEGLSVSNCIFEGHYKTATHTYAMDGVLVATKTFGCTMIGESATGYLIYGPMLEGHTYSNCTFSASRGSYTMRNCLFIDNEVSSGIVSLDPGQESHVDNCVFIRNKSCFCSYESGVRSNFVNNCVFFENKTIITASSDDKVRDTYFIMTNCVYSGQFSNRSVMPALVTSGCRTDLTLETAKFVDPANGNFRLKHNSPLRDKGLVLDWMTEEATDRDGKPRQLGTDGKPCPDAIPDIGCYECDIPKPGLLLLVW